MTHDELEGLAYDLFMGDGEPMRELLPFIERLAAQDYKEAESADFLTVWEYHGKRASIYLKHLRPLIAELNEQGTLAEWIREENEKWY